MCSHSLKQLFRLTLTPTWNYAKSWLFPAKLKGWCLNKFGTSGLKQQHAIENNHPSNLEGVENCNSTIRLLHQTRLPLDQSFDWVIYNGHYTFPYSNPSQLVDTRQKLTAWCIVLRLPVSGILGEDTRLIVCLLPILRRSKLWRSPFDSFANEAHVWSNLWFDWQTIHKKHCEV